MTMRKMMLAATFLFAACGTVQDNAGSGSDKGSSDSGSDGSGSDGSGSDGSGTDAGMGSGSDGMDGGGMPTQCMTAEDCGGGNKACDVQTHECVTGVLTIDNTAFVAEGPRYWTATSNPTLHGLYVGPSSAVIQVIVGNGQGTLATMTGTAWSLTLPANAIGTTDTNVRVMMTDPSGGHVELMETLIVDNVAPRITLTTSTVHDESDDQIDFSSGEPVHAHTGPNVTLTPTGCPVVHKYAYLTGTQDPVFGSQTAPNPIAFRFTIQDTKLQQGSMMYRVRTSDGQTLLDWTALPPPITLDDYSIKLFSDNMAALRTRSGQFYFDVKARDWSGLDSTATWCWNQKLLAPPLKVEALSPGEVFQWSLPSDSPVSSVIESEPPILKQRIVQYTNEAIHLSWTPYIGAVQYTRNSVDDIVTETSLYPIGCPTGTTNPQCAIRNPPVEPADTPASGVSTGLMSISAYEDATNAWVGVGNETLELDIPARAPNDPPKAYLIVVTRSVPELRPSGILYPDRARENQLVGLTFTGGTPTDLGYSCRDMKDTPIGRLCYQVDHYWRAQMLDSATVDFGTITIAFKTQSAIQPLTAVPYLSAAASSSGPLVWNSGNDDLPGALH
ncbi:MAG TPA: hypothetical protein VFV99_09255 [Kofleriaceae bacterium]|nr:hypothetical protein [Kofleriaceae bacterium]